MQPVGVVTLPLELMRAARLTICWLSCLAFFGLAIPSGCGNSPPPITKRTYVIPTTIVQQQAEQERIDKNLELARQRAREQTPREATEPVRMLAALVPQQDTDFFWTFKLQGKPEELEKIKPQFIKLLGSLQWEPSGGVLPAWRFPDGARVKAQEDGFGRVATIMLSDDFSDLQIAVAKFTSTADWDKTVLTNLNRWRGQLKLEPLTSAGIDAATEKVPFAGGDAILMDEVGTAAARPGMLPPAAIKQPPPEATAPSPSETKHEPAANEPSKLIEYIAPDAWNPKRGSALRVATFSVSEGERSAEVAITQFPKVAQMTDPLANVNRWRTELGLPAAIASELPEQTSELKIGDQPAMIFFATGTARDQPTSTLAAMIVRENRVWFVKLQGAATLVSQQRPVFEEFVKTLKFKD